MSIDSRLKGTKVKWKLPITGSFGTLSKDLISDKMKSTKNIILVNNEKMTSVELEVADTLSITFSQTSLTVSWRRSLSYRNQSIDLLCKVMDMFLYDRDLGHERVKNLKILE